MMHSSGAVKKVKSQEQQARQRAAEEMKQRARAAFLSGDALTEEDFESCWPQLRNQIFRQRQRTHYR